MPRHLARLVSRVALNFALDGEAVERGADGLPVAFRLFKQGENDTTKGVFLFDAKAAELVMSAAKEHGVDYAIDLEHLALDQESRAFDPDARGWFQLALRNGDLWAINVRWTNDGARRLSEKTQRFISPAFCVDDENRVTEIVNIALCAMPATHQAPALVAANRRPMSKTLKDRKAELAARLSIAKQKIAKLADGEGGDAAPSGKFAAVQSAASKAAELLAALDSVSGVDEAMGALDAALAAVSEFENVAAAMGAAKSEAPATEGAEAMADAPPPEETEKMARDRAELIALRAEKSKREEEAKVAKLAADMTERADLEAELVKLGRETPVTVKLLSSLSLADLRARVQAFRGVGGVQLGGPKPPTSHGVSIQAGDALIEMSEFEAARVTAYAERRAVELKSAGLTPRPTSEILARYAGHREQQFRGAKTDEQVKRLGRRIEQRHVLLSRDERIVSLASVKPIEEMGPSSQRANEEFVMKYNMCLAAEPKTWAELIGDMMPSGSVTKDTYPINLSALRYRKRTAQDAAAEKALNFDISVTKDEFNSAAQAELRRLNAGDFAYVQWWGRRAEQMARARVYLRNQIVTAILEAGESGYWGSSTELATGIDGQPFFSASHKVNPRNPAMKLRTSATWSNFQSSAVPLTSVNLTAEKSYAYQVADPSGYEFGFEYDLMVVPSSLNEVAKNLLTVQDLIIEAGTVNGVANSFASTRNPHFQSGMEVMRAPDLTGTIGAVTADWYLISRAALSQGLFPWVISEDAAEDLRTWDESSDFTKETGEIKVSSHIYANAVLLFPHGIRKVSGT